MTTKKSAQTVKPPARGSSVEVSRGLTAEGCAAMRARVKELKAEARASKN